MPSGKYRCGLGTIGCNHANLRDNLSHLMSCPPGSRGQTTGTTQFPECVGLRTKSVRCESLFGIFCEQNYRLSVGILEGIDCRKTSRNSFDVNVVSAFEFLQAKSKILK